MTVFGILRPDEIVVATLSAIAAMLAVIAVGWPYLHRTALKGRMRQITHAHELVIQQDRPGNKSSLARPLLRREPRKFFLDILRQLDLLREAEDGATIRLLQRAGYRGRSPVITYLALRVLAPLAMLCLSALYLFILVKPDLPTAALAAIIAASTFGGYFVPIIFLKNRITKRQISIRRAWPNALDLLLICVESGMSSEASFRKVTQEIGNDSAALAEELSLTTAELAYLPDRRTAYENLAKRTDIASVKSAIVGLIQSEKHGTSLGQALRVLSREARETRMAEAEQKAAALPPKLTVPMIVFFLPVLFAVIMAPMVIQMMEN